ncbi:MAG: SLC13 family permease [Luminiphilus sp.]|nr:SLC13 family permease [Luminiphilus sp.]|tara:strand:+ start:8704 stop:10428 length:1725 start_codon:yes stop_codon:yes gene_type:complete
MMEPLLIGLVVAALIASLIFSRLAPSLVFTLAMAACVLVGVIDMQTVMAKATNDGLMTLLLLLMVSVGLERLPWLLALSHRAVKGSLTRTILSLSGMTMLFSAFVNNTAVVATLAGTLRKNPHHAASQILLPVSYAAILGGTLTLIGTSTNLIVSSFLEDITGQGIPFFAFLPVALPAAIAGLIAMLVMHRVLPIGKQDDLPVNEFLIEMVVGEDSRLIGKTVSENGLRDLGDLFLVELVREGRLLTPVAPGEQLEARDRLIFSGDVSKVGVLERFHGLRSFAIDQGLLGMNLTEVILIPGAALIGQTIKESEFRSRFDAAVVGVHRDGERLSGQLGNIRLRVGDSLMLAVGPDFQKRSNLSRNFLIIESSVASHSLSSGKSMAVGAGMFAAVTCSVLEWLPLTTGLMFLLLLMLGLKLFSTAELRRRFPFEMWLIVSSALAISQAVMDSGLMGSAMAFLSPIIGSVPPMMMLVMVYVLTLAMTELITNNAAAALMFPLGYSVALTAGLDPMVFVMAVALGGSASFLTPYGYTTNLMVQNLGGYTRADYVRFGWLVSLAYSTVVLILLPRIFPF